jgi:hypothetical protein
MKIYMLDKTLDVDTTYTAESDKAYIIRKVGTTSASKATLSVGGVDCLEVINELARTHPTQFYLYDLLDLADYYVVVPPDKKFSFSGASGSKLRIVGEILELMPGEALPSPYMGRYAEQGKKYMSYLRGTYSHGTDTAWTAADENNVLSKTAEAGTKYYLTGPVYASLENLAAVHNPGDWTLRFYLQGAPWDILNTGMGDLGVDLWKAYWNDGTNYYYKPFKPTNLPPEIDPGRSFVVSMINSSGASVSPAAGTSLTATVTVGCVVELL